MIQNDALPEQVIGCAFRVSNGVGDGFLEKVYENALAHELRKTGLRVEQQYPIKVVYDGEIVGDYFEDLLVEDRILVELKAVRALDEIHSAQSINYLKATGIPVCLLLNFGTSKIETKRFVNKY
jgi:GxxExxY protein